MRRGIHLVILIVIMQVLKVMAGANEITFAPAVFKSSASQAALLELYSSEGCSSCPPAEKWLGDLKKRPALWTQIVPVAFHVDYWNHLGWPDKFSSKEFTQRQHAYAKNWKSDSVYTPEFVLNGAEWRRSGDILKASKKLAGVLKVSLAENHKIVATFTPSGSKSAEYKIWLALLGADISVAVKSGENGGRKLEHDFVVLSLQQQRMEKTATDLVANLTLAMNQPIISTPRFAIAAWVSAADELTPVQATGGWLQFRAKK